MKNQNLKNQTQVQTKQFRRSRFILIGVLVSASCLFTACGKWSLDSATEEQVYSIDGVKLISTSIVSATDASSTGQESYSLHSEARLLLRFEDFQNHVSKVSSRPSSKVEVQMTFLSPDSLALARVSLKLCPITENWMMFATWNQKHPFSKAGRWAAAGGDYSAAECVSPEVASTTPAPSASSSPAPGSVSGPVSGGSDGAHDDTASSGPQSPIDLRFDMTPWFLNYAKGRGENYGFVLITDRSVTVAGEKSGSHSPRIIWRE